VKTYSCSNGKVVVSVVSLLYEKLIFWGENPFLVGKILVAVVSPNICATTTTVRTVLNIQTSASVPVDDLSIHKFPLLPLDSVASVHLHFMVISAIIIVVSILIQTLSRGSMLNSSIGNKTPKFGHREMSTSVHMHISVIGWHLLTGVNS